VVREAEAEATRLLNRARIEEQLVRERTANASRNFAAYVAALRALMERHLAELDALEAAARASAPAPVAPQPPPAVEPAPPPPELAAASTEDPA
jgi:hypothetical protein